MDLLAVRPRARQSRLLMATAVVVATVGLVLGAGVAASAAVELPAPTITAVTVATTNVPYWHGRATVAWTPVVGATSYVVSVWSASDGTLAEAVVAPAAATAVEVGGLVGAPQVFSVQAVDGQVPSVPSAPVTAPVLTYPLPPDPARITVDTTTQPGRTIVGWPAAYDGGSPVTSYSVTQRLGGTQVLPGNATSAAFEGTDAFTSDFTVVATNALGSSVAVAAASASQPPRPDQPEKVNATAVNGDVRLTWEPPKLTGGSPIVSYTVFMSTVKPHDVPRTSFAIIRLAQIVDPDARGVHFTDVPRGIYWAQVEAANAAGGTQRGTDDVDMRENGTLPGRVEARPGARVTMRLTNPSMVDPSKLRVRLTIRDGVYSWPATTAKRQKDVILITFTAPKKVRSYHIDLQSNLVPDDPWWVAASRLYVSRK